VPRSGRVVLGGTFDHLHVGHEALLATAFRAGRPVAIGLTTTSYLRRHHKPGARRIQAYAVRRRHLAEWLAHRYPRARWTIVPISDAFGGSVEDGVAVLVVSADTVAGGRAVNAERARRGRSTVPVLVVPLVLADDLRPVSSRRIRSGAIDRDGRRISPISVAVVTDRRSDRAAAVAAVRHVFPRARIHRRDAARRGNAAGTRGSTEITLVVRAGRRGDRRVRLATREVSLPMATVHAGTPASLERGIERLIHRAAPANPLNRARR
jgi:pantetheine-phosphate adenylyltransferase